MARRAHAAGQLTSVTEIRTPRGQVLASDVREGVTTNS
jgi:hypothetical protein